MYVSLFIADPLLKSSEPTFVLKELYVARPDRVWCVLLALLNKNKWRALLFQNWFMSSPSYHIQPDQIWNSAGMLTLTVIWQWLMRYQVSSVPLSPVLNCWLFRSQLNYNNLYLSEETCFKNFNEEHSCVLLCQHMWPPWGQRKTATIWARSIQQLLSFRLLSWFVIYQNSSGTKRKLFFRKEPMIS